MSGTGFAEEEKKRGAGGDGGAQGVVGGRLGEGGPVAAATVVGTLGGGEIVEEGVAPGDGGSVGKEDDGFAAFGETQGESVEGFVAVFLGGVGEELALEKGEQPGEFVLVRRGEGGVGNIGRIALEPSLGAQESHTGFVADGEPDGTGNRGRGDGRLLRGDRP